MKTTMMFALGIVFLPVAIAGFLFGLCVQAFKHGVFNSGDLVIWLNSK